jgi:hypothetical protein
MVSPKGGRREEQMNTKQLRTLLVGLVLIVLMGLFPPWIYTYEGVFHSWRYERRAGYRFILNPPPRAPAPNDASMEAHIDGLILAIQCVTVAIIVGGIIVTQRERRVRLRPTV